MDLHFVTASTSDAELHFDSVTSLDSLAQFLQVHGAVFGVMRRGTHGIDGHDLFVVAVECPPERAFLVSPALILPVNCESEVGPGPCSYEFVMCEEIVASIVEVFGELVYSRLHFDFIIALRNIIHIANLFVNHLFCLL